jgi:hypothetical protein
MFTSTRPAASAPGPCTADGVPGLTLLHIINEHTIDLRKRQLDLIGNRHGLMSFMAHPDYLIDRRSRRVFASLLDYLQQRIAQEKIWAALPGHADRWWRARSPMKLVPRGSDWDIDGPEQERVRLAYLVIDGSHRLVYELAPGVLSGARGRIESRCTLAWPSGRGHT